MEMTRVSGDKSGTDPYSELEKGVYAALGTYSNVHRGSGHYSMISTCLYEEARDIVLEHLGLEKRKYTAIFCTPACASVFLKSLSPGSYRIVSSQDLGLPLGVRALAIRKKALPRGAPFQAGGGTARLVAPGWVIWAGAPDRFEAGTPAIINAITFARALRLTGQAGKGIFQAGNGIETTAGEILYHDGLEGLSGKRLLYSLRTKLMGYGMPVPTTGGEKKFINLDYAASTPTFQPVWEAVCRTWRQPPALQQDIIREVRFLCAEMMDAPQDRYEVIFTSNTTEAINLVAESMGNEPPGEIQTVVLQTLLEHTSNDLPWRMASGSTFERLTVDESGFLDLKELDKVLHAYNSEGRYGKKRIRLVALSGASNVLGVYNDLEAISRIVHHYGAHLLVDGAQLVAHRPVGMARQEIDYLAFSAHKAYAPFGTGVLIAGKGLLRLSPARLDTIRASGEENTAGIAALGKALVILKRIGMEVVMEEEQTLTARVLRGFAQIPQITVYGIKDPDSPQFARKGGVIAFSIKNVMPNQVARRLAEKGGIGIRYGCHCAHLIVKHILHVPHGLEQFQKYLVTLFPGITLPGVARVSLGIGNTLEEIDRFIEEAGRLTEKSRINMRKQLRRFTDAAVRRVYS